MSGAKTVARRMEDGRLAWYENEPDTNYWTDYWSDRLGDGYHDRAATAELRSTPIGRRVADRAAAGDRVLEAGCGLGWWVAALRARDVEAEGIESAAELVEMLASRALAIDRPDHHYDGYLSFGVIEHRAAGPEPFLTEAARVTRPGGFAVFSVPHLGPVRRTSHRLRGDDDAGALPFYQYAFTGQSLAAAVSAAGFDIEAVAHEGINRLLVEEVPGYGWTQRHRGARGGRCLGERLLAGRDGHMVAVAARRR